MIFGTIRRTYHMALHNIMLAMVSIIHGGAFTYLLQIGTSMYVSTCFKIDRDISWYLKTVLLVILTVSENKEVYFEFQKA